MRRYTKKRESEERRQKKWRDRRLEGAVCRIRWGNCTGRATTLHHRVKRSAMRSAIHYIGDPEWDGWQFVESCAACNSAIEDEPARAKEESWTVTPHQAEELFPHLFQAGMFVGRANR